MNIKEVEAKSILRKHKKIDSWFISQYGMNLYRGCSHNCVYCDGRAEKYYVDGEFGEDITVKTNAVEILRRELNPQRRRIPLRPSLIMIGGGVGDSYQPVERQYQLTRKTLKLIAEYRLPVHILTKSALVKRDIDIIKQINGQSQAIISFSFSSVSDELSSIFEPKVISPQKRLELIRFFKSEGLACGIFLLPVLPLITDTPELIENTISEAKKAGVDFIIFGTMTLKEGRQQDYFFKTIRPHYPHLASRYKGIYRGNRWGQVNNDYAKLINIQFNSLTRSYKIPKRIPPHLYRTLLNENDLVIVILEHIEYLLRLNGKKSSFGYAAYSISQIKQNLSTIKDSLVNISGVNRRVRDIIIEILETRDCIYYQELLTG